MALILTCFDDRIKIRVFKAHWVSTPSQTWSKLLKISKEFGFDVKLWKVLFCKDFDLVWPLVNPGLTRGILVILAEKGTLSTPTFEQVAPCHYMCSCDPMEKKWYFFGFSRVWHANRGWKKYSTNRCPLFIWYLECNERCWIKYVISDFVAPKLRMEATYGSKPVFRVYWIELILLKLKTENWKHCSKIIFKYVNNAIGPIFNEKIDKKWNL